MSEASGFINLDLMETGTRYEHYSELAEVFKVGIELLRGIDAHNNATVNAAKMEKLKNAVEMVEGRIDILSKYREKSTYGGFFRASIDVAHKMALVKGDKNDEGRSDDKSNQTDSST